jgi:mannosyltransferase OCH1-like enzyme
MLTFQELNPEYTYLHFNDDECRIYIKNNFDEKILSAYDSLVPGAYKADLFRYCFMYKHGGCYFDCKMILYEPLRNIIKKDDTIVICNDDIPNAYLNAIIMMTPNNNRLLDLIAKICYYVENKSYRDNETSISIGTHALSITGPIIFYEFFSHITPSMFFIRTDKDPNNYYIYGEKYVNSIKLCKKQYNGYYSVYSDKNPRYDVLYRDRMIYK